MLTTREVHAAYVADHDAVLEALDLDGWVLTALWADEHRNEISVEVPDDLDDDQIPTGWWRWRYAV